MEPHHRQDRQSAKAVDVRAIFRDKRRRSRLTGSVERRHCGSVQRHDDLVWTNESEVLAHQLVGHVRVSLVRVEQPRMMLEPRALLLDLGELDLPLLERAMIATPGEDSIGSGDRMAGKGPDHDQRQRRQRRASDHRGNAAPLTHDSRESQGTRPCKRKVWNGGYSVEKTVDQSPRYAVIAARPG